MTSVSWVAAVAHFGASTGANLCVSEVTQVFSRREGAVALLHMGAPFTSVAAATVEAESCRNSRRVLGDIVGATIQQKIESSDESSLTIRCSCDGQIRSGTVSTAESLKGRSRGQRLSFFFVRIVLHSALGVENHGGASLSRESGPVRKPMVIGVTTARELNPCLADIGCQLPGRWAAACQVFTSVGIVEAKRQFAAMDGARPAVQNRRLPGKLIKIGRRSLRRLAHCLNHRALPHLRGHGQGTNIEWLRARVGSAEYLRDALGIVAVHVPQPLLHLRLGHRLVFGMIQGGVEFVERGAD